MNEIFSWQWHYYFLTAEGVKYLREYLGLPATVIPSTHKFESPAVDEEAQEEEGQERRQNRRGRGRGERGRGERGQGRGRGRGRGREQHGEDRQQEAAGQE